VRKDHHPQSAIPNNGAACYFCLEEGPDDEGKSLVRDCSCRGDSAGFAHLSCLTKYAEQKCKKVVDGKSHHLLNLLSHGKVVTTVSSRSRINWR
jgi:hypothetical protein